MKVALTIFLIIGFIGIAVFGVFAMDHGSGHSHNGCIAATAQGTDCPKRENAIQFLTFHLDAFRSFSTATFGDNLASSFLLLIALALIAAFGVIAGISPARPALVMNCRRRQFLESHSFPFQQELTHWLALHENSPATS